MAISITRALAEIKNLDAQIAKLTSEGRFVYTTKGQGDKLVVNGVARPAAALSEDIKSKFQKITDLIARRRSMKAAIQKSNANTIIVVAGMPLVVADAIERKNNIVYEANLHTQLRQQYLMCMQSVDKNNATLDQQIETAVTQAYSNDKGKVTPEQYEAVAAPRKAEHQAALLDPLGIEHKLEKMGEAINAFLLEIDFSLSESNARTEITLD
jgi:hypothetical protein